MEYFDTDTLIVIGNRCKQIRENYNEYRKLSQREFAKKLGISHSRISLIEKGKAEMTLTELHAYQNETGYSFDYFMGKNECKKADNEEICKRLGLTEEAIELLEDVTINSNKETKEFDADKEICKLALYTLNHLLKNKYNYYLLGSLGNFLWFRKRNKQLIERNQDITDDDLGYSMTIKQYEALQKVQLDEALFNMKNNIEKATDKSTTNIKTK